MDSGPVNLDSYRDWESMTMQGEDFEAVIEILLAGLFTDCTPLVRL
jgi:hypothetical protein